MTTAFPPGCFLLLLLAQSVPPPYSEAACAPPPCSSRRWCWCSSALQTVLQRSAVTVGASSSPENSRADKQKVFIYVSQTRSRDDGRREALPSPDEDDSLSAREAESAWSCDSPSIRGMDSSDDGTDES